MKITDIHTLCLSRRHEPELIWFSSQFRVFKADCPVVTIETDEGIQGIAEPSTYGDPPKIRERIDRMKPDLIGRDPLDPDLVTLATGDRQADITNAGIELAQWDIRGKIEGKQVAELLVPELTPDQPDRKPKKRLRLYASAGVQYDWDDHPESVIDEAVRLADEGFTAYKMRIGTHWGWSGVTLDRFIDLVRKVTDAVGDRLELKLEGNTRFNQEDALRMGHVLDELGWDWFEEPLDKSNVEGYARLNAALDLPITGGESNSRLADFEPFFESNAYSIAQLDVGVCGMAEALRIARRAAECGIRLIPQNWHNGLLTVSNAHLIAALPHDAVLEQFVGQGPLQWDILKEQPDWSEGHFVMPEAPGWGVDLGEDLETRFPWIDGPWGEREER